METKTNSIVDATKKQPYSSPIFIEYGDLAQLTHAVQNYRAADAVAIGTYTSPVA